MRTNMIRNQLVRSTAIAAAMLALLAVGGCAGGGDAASRTSADDHAALSQTIPAGAVNMYVNGLACPLCTNNLDKALRSVAGVNNVDVDLGTGEVVVHVAGEPAVTRAELARVVEESGFTLVRFAN